ncbi:MAG: hypothetical protein KKB30_03795 [Proteobacteria bacterium]|nr:hypothetical protein [Pseudomonadota bacterium]MBU1715640.1 hypothetical protein [Pseudomonadota bacterium]
MNLKEVYEKKMEVCLDEWGTEIDLLKAKTDKVKAAACVKYYKQVEEINIKTQAVGVKLAEL